VTRSSRHRSTRHTHVSSHGQLVTGEHITKAPVPVVSICTPSGDIQKLLNTDGVITAICVILMYTAYYRSRRQITLVRKARSTRHTPWNTTVNLSHDFTMWWVDHVTSWLVPFNTWAVVATAWSRTTTVLTPLQRRPVTINSLVGPVLDEGLC